MNEGELTKYIQIGWIHSFHAIGYQIYQKVGDDDYLYVFSHEESWVDNIPATYEWRKVIRVEENEIQSENKTY